jgi:hypothetical protein
MTDVEQEEQHPPLGWWPEDLDFGPEDVVTTIENSSGEPFDMTGEPWWKRLWFRILFIPIK